MKSARGGLFAFGVAVLVWLGSTFRLESQTRVIEWQVSGPGFEVASIKPAPPPGAARDPMGLQVSGDTVRVTSWSLRQLILKAYQLETFQIAGPPSLDTARFDVLAKMTPGTAMNQVPEMLKRLLAERFGLRVHTETKEVFGFALRVDKGGLKMRPATPDPNAPPLSTVNTRDELMGDGKAFGMVMGVTSRNAIRVGFTRLPMSALAQFTASYLREPVFNMTGLEGAYQGSLEFAPSLLPESDAPSLEAAVRRLGLNLERRKGSIEILVVDSVRDSPTAN